MSARWGKWNVRLVSPLVPENIDVARANREREQVFCGNEDIDGHYFRDYF